MCLGRFSHKKLLALNCLQLLIGTRLRVHMHDF
jgi:hypothetical protein